MKNTSKYNNAVTLYVNIHSQAKILSVSIYPWRQAILYLKMRQFNDSSYVRTILARHCLITVYDFSNAFISHIIKKRLVLIYVFSADSFACLCYVTILGREWPDKRRDMPDHKTSAVHRRQNATHPTTSPHHLFLVQLGLEPVTLRFPKQFPTDWVTAAPIHNKR